MKTMQRQKIGQQRAKRVRCGKPALFILLIIAFVLVGAVAPGLAQDAQITEMVVANSKRDLLLFFRLTDAMNKEMETGVQNGLPITFTFETTLERVRSGWPDKKIFSGKFEHTLSYDSLKKVYSVKKTENRVDFFLTDDFSEAKSMMCEINGFAVLALAELEPDHEYVIKVKATLAKNTLPLYFHYLVPFSDIWDLDTDWYEVKFRY